ncbi:MAG: decaprenyl-phosphate phosphoribosyltransferase [Clostridia bacterium]|nr:decaprenyl-phosphate phosphoribosyltransferase [Clostridia bacterium]
MKKVASYIKLMRPHHYIKNILIFLPLVFSKNIFNGSLLINVVIGAIAFSLMSSIVYILNDILDVEADKKHEKKKYRPIASGAVSIRNAIILAIILFILSILLNWYIKSNMVALCVFYGYLLMNILYSVKLKHVPIVDIVILAFGFMLRVFYGSAITEIAISDWLYITILAFSFYMGLGKRRNEFRKMGKDGREVLKYYNETFLTSNLYMCMALGIVFYSLWCVDVNASALGRINIIWTVPLVMIICMRYSLNIEGDSLGDPVDVILGDKLLIALAGIYSVVMFMALYL